MNTIKERITKSARYYGLSMRKFEEKCQLNRGVLSNMSESSSLGSDKLAYIFANCHEISSDWLITGCGEMLRDQNVPSVSRTRSGGAQNNAQTIQNQGKDTKNNNIICIACEEKERIIECMKETIETQKTLIQYLTKEQELKKFAGADVADVACADVG
jgi:Asp/Glu/hydantoin racemase